ncbi:hypothetical protein SDC9_141241 [bioreactor metagenome]|uniref:Fe-only nitrogenase accessory protein AnfO n=1 Tax=bioreactor metagenome TaxID=1076179 RepID=A0A645DY89_9ZZZZ
MKIAVIENDSQQTSSMFKPGFITIYEEDGREWKVLERFENKVCNAKGMAEVRMAVKDIIKQLGDVKIIVASEIPGIASGTFQASGFDIFFVENSVPDILSSIKKEMLETIEEGHKEPSKFDITQFLKPGVNKGDFSINIEEIMFKHPDLTSKKILIPYLKNGEFNSLDVICSHIPKWFITDLSSMGFEYETVNESLNKVTVRVTNVKTP